MCFNSEAAKGNVGPLYSFVGLEISVANSSSYFSYMTQGSSLAI
jgi:hypothetical protein